ncbi:hypothetical protein [Natronorubrum sp. DTA7]|uniref:hypothetical protein n=1 Tax=Natronorubrum sp. DTA7 TaxID=3447016 RepID=UPI003F8784F1
MTASVDTTEKYIEQLDEDADKIVSKIDQLYNDAEKGHKVVGNSLPVGAADRGRTKPMWEDPKGKNKELQDNLKQEYESWYARAEELVSTHLPQRLDEFEKKRTKVKEYIRLDVNAKFKPERYVNSATEHFSEQRNLVKAIPGKIKAEKLSLRRQISDTFSKDELLQARELLDEGLARAAGVLAGVAIERHLQLECDESDLKYNHNDGIASLAQTLYEGDEIAKTTLSNLETLGQIRNDCAHANQQQPNKHKVRKLIDDTDDYIRGRGI